MSTSPVLRHLGDLKKYAITAQDNVKQIYLAGPDYGCSASVFFEVWEPGASQPPTATRARPRRSSSSADRGEHTATTPPPT
jgi:hypothetical protein